MIIGYARVSTTGQTLSAQDAALKAAGCAKVFRETASGAKTDRPVLAKLLKALEPGDQVVVTRLDRLARSTRDLLNTLDRIGKAESTFRSIADTWADSSTPHGKLPGMTSRFTNRLMAVELPISRQSSIARINAFMSAESAKVLAAISMGSVGFGPVTRRWPRLHGRTRPANIDHESAGGEKWAVSGV